MTVPIFVGHRILSVPPGTTAAAAVALAGGPADALASGRAFLTDGRGIRLDPATPLGPGAIVRVVVSARAGEEPAGGDA